MTGRQARAQIWGRPRGRSGINVNRRGYHRYSPARNARVGATPDNKAGPKTRQKLIEEYMALVGEPLSKDPQYQSTITTHGGGENFPLSDAPEATSSDTAATQDPGTSPNTDTSQDTDTSADTEAATDQAVNRRVEFFFFDREYGIDPPVPGKNSQAGSTEHPTWKDAVVQKVERNVPAVGQPSGTDFVVTVIDELKQPIVGVGLLFQHGSTSDPVTTDVNGVARYEAPGVTSVTVTFESAKTLATIMKPIWTPARQVERKDWVQEDDRTTLVTLLGGNVAKVLPVDPSTDTTRPVERIKPFFGVQPTLKKSVVLSVQPLIIMKRLLGEHFDVDKSFLLPKALDSARQIVFLHKEYSLTDLLIVGHADTSSTDEHNLTLSLERTSAMRAYLTNDADGWLPWYNSDKQQSKRWGSTEDNHMMMNVMDTTNPPTVDEYREWHNANETELKSKAAHADKYETITESGKIGSVTRKQLILDYMNREDTTIRDGTTIHVHGCGEFFPLEKNEEAVDPNAPDNQREQRNRRVEVFLFPREIGMLPPIPGDKAKKGEQEYPEWRRRSIDILWRLINLGGTDPTLIQWYTDVPSWATPSDVRLVALCNGVEMGSVPLSTALQIEDKYCFDISGFDRDKTYSLELRQGTLLLAASVNLQVNSLKTIADTNDLDDLNDTIFGVNV